MRLVIAGRMRLRYQDCMEKRGRASNRAGELSSNPELEIGETSAVWPHLVFQASLPRLSDQLSNAHENDHGFGRWSDPLRGRQCRPPSAPLEALGCRKFVSGSERPLRRQIGDRFYLFVIFFEIHL